MKTRGSRYKRATLFVIIVSGDAAGEDTVMPGVRGDAGEIKSFVLLKLVQRWIIGNFISCCQNGGAVGCSAASLFYFPIKKVLMPLAAQEPVSYPCTTRTGVLSGKKK